MMTKEEILGRLLKKVTDFSPEKLGVLYDLVEKLSESSWLEWLAELKKFLRKKQCWRFKVLKLVSNFMEEFTIGPIANETDLTELEEFFDEIHPPFFYGAPHGISLVSEPTVETPVELYEMSDYATFFQIFGELGVNPRKICFTPYQIGKFVHKYPGLLGHRGLAMLFLFQAGGDFFVACVRHQHGKTLMFVSELGCSGEWDPNDCNYVVIPKTT